MSSFRRRSMGLLACCAGVAAVSITATSALALDSSIMPALDHREPTFDSLRNATRSGLVADLKRTAGAYVLPPQTGLVTLRNVTLTEANQLCPAMRELQAQARTLSARMAELILDVGPLESELTLLQNQRNEAQARVAEFSDYTILQDAVDELAFDLDDLAYRSDELRSQFCASTPCPSDVAEELEDIEQRRLALEAEQSELEAQASVRETAYRQALSDRAAIDAQMEARERAYRDQLDRVQALRQSILDMYAVYARTVGGSAEIQYQSGWLAAIKRLRSDNPSLWFEPVPTRDARVHPTLIPGIGTDAYLASNPAVLDYLVNGVSVAAEAPVEPLPVYPESVQAEARLSLVSSCVVADPAAYDVEKAGSGVPLFGLTVSYEYPSVFQAETVVSYNLWQLHQIVTERYFGARALEDALERARNSGAVTFAWDARDSLSADQKHAFELRVFWQLLQQLWTHTRAPSYDPDSVRVYGGPAAPSQGVAPVVARNLVLRSVTGAARYTSSLAEVTLGRTAANGERLVGAVALGTRDQLSKTALPTGATLISLDTRADQLLETVAIPNAALALGRVTSAQPQLAHLALPAPALAVSKASAISARALSDPELLPARELAPVVDVREPRETPELAFQAVSIPNDLPPDQTRIVANGLSLARRALDRDCGWYHLTCNGLSWVARTRLSEKVLQEQLDRLQNVRYSRVAVSYLTGATVFAP